jgi:hypothetical protein
MMGDGAVVGTADGAGLSVGTIVGTSSILTRERGESQMQHDNKQVKRSQTPLSLFLSWFHTYIHTVHTFRGHHAVGRRRRRFAAAVGRSRGRLQRSVEDFPQQTRFVRRIPVILSVVVGNVRLVIEILAPLGRFVRIEFADIPLVVGVGIAIHSVVVVQPTTVLTMIAMINVIGNARNGLQPAAMSIVSRREGE